MSVIVAQTVSNVLEHIRELVGDTPSHPVQFTSDLGELLRYVRDNKGGASRTVVVSSNRYYGADMVNKATGDMVAAAVNDLDPDAWFFLYTVDEPQRTEHIDGIIPKNVDGYGPLLSFLCVDFDKVTSVEELRRIWLPWLK